MGSRRIDPKQQSHALHSQRKEKELSRKLLSSSEIESDFAREHLQANPYHKYIGAKLSSKEKATKKRAAGAADRAAEKAVFANKGCKTKVLPELKNTNTSYTGEPK